MRAIRGLMVLAVTAALVAACGGSSGSGGGTSSAPTVAVKAGPATGWSAGGFKPNLSTLQCDTKAPDPTRGVTATSIKVGGLAYLTSPDGSSMAGTDIGAKVRFERANAAGGINGRKIDYVGTLDDGNDPGRDGTQANALVEQKDVFAAVPVMAAYTNYFDTFCKNVVPFFGWGFNSGYCRSAIGFGITGCAVGDPSQKVTSDGLGVTLQGVLNTNDLAGKTVAILGVDNDSARLGNRLLAKQIEVSGAKVVYDENPIPLTGITDTTPVVNAVMRSNKGAPPDVILQVADFSSVLKLTQAVNAAGFTGKNLNPLAYDPRLSTFKGLNKTYIFLQWQPGVDTANPAIAQMIADFKKYAPNQTLSLPAMAGYWAADLFVDAVTKTGRNLTVDTLLKTLNGGSYSYYPNGAVPQTRWPLNHFVAPPCGATVQLTPPKYTITQNLSCGSLVPE